MRSTTTIYMTDSEGLPAGTSAATEDAEYRLFAAALGIEVEQPLAHERMAQVKMPASELAEMRQMAEAAQADAVEDAEWQRWKPLLGIR